MTISDDDIINNLNSLQNKVNGIITKTTESMKPELVEVENVNDASVNKSILSLPTSVNMNTVIFITIPLVTLLILYFTQPFFIMEEVKVENTFFTKKEMSVLLLLAYTLGLSIIFYLIVFICIYDLTNI
uniref:Uncharacterized protein n=1 Tax=viral metagenome TaxID=1070528 RepID=A0A6C0E1G6_9ZZZZ